MSTSQAVSPGCPRDRRTKPQATRRLRRVALLAGAAGVTAAVLTSCSGPTDGSSSSGEGAVGAAGTSAGGSAAADAHQAYQTVGAVGTQPGSLIIKPASGSTSISPTWSTTDACPVGYQTSAQLDGIVFGSANLFQWISGTLNPGNSPIPADQQLEFNSTVAQVQQATKTPNGQTDKWVVKCTALNSGLGNREYVQYVLVHISADGKSYTTSS
jgi:hypothetical protein